MFCFPFSNEEYNERKTEFITVSEYRRKHFRDRFHLRESAPPWEWGYRRTTGPRPRGFDGQKSPLSTIGVCRMRPLWAIFHVMCQCLKDCSIGQEA